MFGHYGFLIDHYLSITRLLIYGKMKRRWIRMENASFGKKVIPSSRHCAANTFSLLEIQIDWYRLSGM